MASNYLSNGSSNEISEIIFNFYISAKHCFDQQEYSLAIKAYEKIIKNDPYEIFAYQQLTFCHLKIKDYLKVCEIAEEVINRNDNFKRSSEEFNFFK